MGRARTWSALALAGGLWFASACGEATSDAGKPKPAADPGRAGAGAPPAGASARVAGAGALPADAGAAAAGSASSAPRDAASHDADAPPPDAGAAPPLPLPGVLPAGWSPVTPWIDPVSGLPGGDASAVAVGAGDEGYVLMSGAQLVRVERDGRWGAAQALVPDSTDYTHAIAVGDDDHGLALGASESTGLDWFAREPGAAWVARGTIAASAGQKVAEPQLVLGPARTAFALWLECTGADSARLLAARFDGVSWSAPHTLDSRTYCRYAWPSLATDANGRAIAVWRAAEVLDATYDHAAASAFDGDGWSAATWISGEVPLHLPARVAMDAEGRAIAVFSFHVLQAVSFEFGRGWDTPMAIGVDSAQGALPKIAFDGSGRAWALWVELPDWGQMRVIARPYRASEGWGDAITLSHPRGSAGELALALNRSGHAVVAWGARSSSDVKLESIWATLHEPESGWSAPVILHEGGLHSGGRHWDAAINARGHALIAWRPWFEHEHERTGAYAVVHAP